MRKIRYRKYFYLCPINDNLRIVINGPVILLFGPIGSYFSRLSDYLKRQLIPVYKVSFIMNLDLKKVKDYLLINLWMNLDFLKHKIIKLNVKHIFMYGDFILPHKIAISLCEKLKNKTLY